MKILGLSCFYHDSAASLIIDGKIIAAVQEERFTRIKHDPGFPEHAIKYCLEEANLNINDLDQVVFYEDPQLKFKRLLETYRRFFPKSIPLVFKSLPGWLISKRNWKKNLMKDFANCGLRFDPKKLSNNEHHLSHAASAFFCSPFDEAGILIMDGVGEFATTSFWHGKNNKIIKLDEVKFPDSLGLLYSTLTSYLGFKVNSGEYKVMGLAPYGEPKYADIFRENLINLNNKKFSMDMKYFDYPFGTKMFNEEFSNLFGKSARSPETDLNQFHMDVAASLQLVTEEAVIKLAKETMEISKSENLCLAGGVALNCVANGKIIKKLMPKGLWVQPASGDAGGSLGAAFNYYFNVKNKDRTVNSNDLMEGSYLGPRSSEEEIISMIKDTHAKSKKMSREELNNKVSDLLADGKVVGWHQGRAEFGPRALGNRSILGDARNIEMQKTMNLKIKYRESFRPFAPAVIAEDLQDYFKLNQSSPYMMIVDEIVDSLKINQDKLDNSLFGIEKLNQIRSKLSAITHVDYSARIQTVHNKTNKAFYDLLVKFKEKTNSSVVVNTSFNVRGEPIVLNPNDSYRCFMRTEMDVLVIEDYIFIKSEQPEYKESGDWTTEFELD